MSFLALCGVLERAVQESVLDNYYLNCGVAMELRFAEGARATKDVDIGLVGERAERLQTFRDALALGFDEFSFQLKGKPLSMDNADAVRLELGVLYRTRAWQTIDIDLGPAGSGEVDLVEPTIRGLSAMGLRIPSPVRCLNLSEQVAQKLHACTGPYSKGRARDVLDILLIDLLGKIDATAVRVAASMCLPSGGHTRFHRQSRSRASGDRNSKPLPKNSVIRQPPQWRLKPGSAIV